MTVVNSTGTPGENSWDTTELVFRDEMASNPVFMTHHELRRTPNGRKWLHEHGVSMSGYTKKDRSTVPYHQRRFVAWDGEGVQGEQISATSEIIIGDQKLTREYLRQKSTYVLFGNSDGDYVASPDLDTETCLRLIIEKADKDAIHFGFAFGYDVNMLLRDLSANHLKALKETGSVRWRQWWIEYRPRKWFAVKCRRSKKYVKIWDVFGFFMCSALKAWEEYQVEVSETVKRGKMERGVHGYDKLWTEIFPYWNEENQAYVALMNKLRESLHAADLFISAWHGPGAIASHSLAKHKIDRSKANVPDQVNEAARYAYGGGRFEMLKCGRANQTVYQYDINSAYPYAISQLPSLANGRWAYRSSNDLIRSVARMGVYHIRFQINPFAPTSNLLRSMPFLHRDERGRITFPCVVDTWVWSPELWGKAGFPGLEIIEGWEFVEESEERPFAWLAENYAIRKEYKRNGNPAQLALKLQMNSMYGKLAQRVGWNQEKMMPPKWHQLEWAGWVTSYCRAMVFKAGLHAGTDLVSYETDAVYTTKRIAEHLDIGDGLGQWEETVYDDFIYLQSGAWFGLQDGQWKDKYRGFDKGSLDVDAAMTALSLDSSRWAILGTTQRFVGFAQALHTDFLAWREFQTDKSRAMRIGGEGKRRHIPKLCRACHSGATGADAFHDCANAIPVPANPVSERHHLPWKDVELLTSQNESDDEKWAIHEW